MKDDERPSMITFLHVPKMLQPFLMATIARLSPTSPGATSGGTQRMVRSPSSKSSVIMFGPEDVATVYIYIYIRTPEFAAFDDLDVAQNGPEHCDRTRTDQAKALTHALLHDLGARHSVLWLLVYTFMKLQPSGLWMFESTSSKKATALFRIQAQILQITSGERPGCNRGSMLAYFLGRHMSDALVFQRQFSCGCLSTSGKPIITSTPFNICNMVQM